MQEIYEVRVVSHRQAEFNRLRREREERISRILQSRRQEREKMRKLKYYLKLEEERQQKMREEEEARKREGIFLLFVGKVQYILFCLDFFLSFNIFKKKSPRLSCFVFQFTFYNFFLSQGNANATLVIIPSLTHNVVITCLYLSMFCCNSEAERRKKEEAERLAKLAEIAEKQRQRERELEEKERQRREALLGRSVEAAPPARQSEPVTAPAAAAAAAAAAPNPGKYVPKFMRDRAERTGTAPPPETDRWGGNSSSRPDGDRWRGGDDRRSSYVSGGGSRSSSSWSRNPR